MDYCFKLHYQSNAYSNLEKYRSPPKIYCNGMPVLCELYTHIKTGCFWCLTLPSSVPGVKKPFKSFQMCETQSENKPHRVSQRQMRGLEMMKYRWVRLPPQCILHEGQNREISVYFWVWVLMLQRNYSALENNISESLNWLLIPHCTVVPWGYNSEKVGLHKYIVKSAAKAMSIY